MKNIDVDLAIVGSGPAGMAAALKAKSLGIDKVLIIERDVEAGGILQQCIHDGFGLHRFNKRMAGTEYAQTFIDDLEKEEITIKYDTMVLEITPEKEIYACSKEEGMIKISCGAIILAMGCRERTASQIQVLGYRPQGVMTAGSVQRYINMEGYLPGKQAVILGSGDIGLIMARRMTLENIEVKGVYEAMASPGGLIRNIVQCLDDFDIPLHLSTTVTWIHGKEKLEGVTVAKIDKNRNIIPGSEEYLACDLLVLAVGLIPENELSQKAGVEIDPKTKGPIVDNHFMTSVPGIFAAGNVAVVFDLVDYVSDSGEIAAMGASMYLQGKLSGDEKTVAIEAGDNVNFVVPQVMRKIDDQATKIFLRVKTKDDKVKLECFDEKEILYTKKFLKVAPPEMIACTIPAKESKIIVQMKGDQ